MAQDLCVEKCCNCLILLLYVSLPAPGPERKGAVIEAKNRELVAYHEGGHALVALYTPEAIPIHKATIVPRGDSLGMVCIVHKRVLCILCKKKREEFIQIFLEERETKKKSESPSVIGFSSLQLFLERLFFKSVKAYTTGPNGFMGNCSLPYATSKNSIILFYAQAQP